MRLLVAEILHDRLGTLPMNFPESNEQRQEELKKYIEVIEKQNLD
jgi:hypothetical protein